jgi:hypothetical protein
MDVGARRIISDIRAAVGMSIPAGQGRQYPQPLQKSALSSFFVLRDDGGESLVQNGG